MNGLETASKVLDEALDKEAFDVILGRALVHAATKLGGADFMVNVNNSSWQGRQTITISKNEVDIASFTIKTEGRDSDTDRIVESLQQLSYVNTSLSNIETSLRTLIDAIKELKNK